MLYISYKKAAHACCSQLLLNNADFDCKGQWPGGKINAFAETLLLKYPLAEYLKIVLSVLPVSTAHRFFQNGVPFFENQGSLRINSLF